MSTLSLERLKELLEYSPRIGRFFWKATYGRAKVGSIAGVLNPKYGRRYIGVCGRYYYEGPLAWFYMTSVWPVNEVDHRDGNPGNNRWSNLRQADRSQQQCNTRTIRSNNKSGYRGVFWNKEHNQWNAVIGFRRISYNLGYFDDPAEASRIYEEAREILHGDFRRGA